MPNEPIKVPGFFPTIAQLFKGPGTLVNLYETSPVRAVLRLLLLTFLCSLFYAIAVTTMEDHKTAPVMERFKQSAGDLVITPERIAFSVNPDQSRVLKLNRFNVGYFPKQTFKPEFFASNKESFGIEILDRCAVVWFATTQNEDDKLFNVLLVTLQDFSNLLSNRISYPTNKYYTRKELMQILSENQGIASATSPDKVPVADFQSLTFSADYLYRTYICVWGIISFLQSFVYDIILLGLTVFLVSVVQMLYSGSRPNSLKIGQAVSVTVYSSFVALIIATILSIPETQFLSFTTIFFILFMIYQIVGFAKIQHAMNPTREQDK